jgi:STE24 endopeptidase
MVPFPPNIEHLVDALYPPARQALALEVANTARRLFWLGAALQLAIFAGLYFSGIANRLRERVERLIQKERPATTLSRLLIAAVVIAAVLLISAIVTLPLTWYDSFTLMHRYDLSRETPANWLHDWAVGLALGILIAAVLGAVFFELVHRFDRAWPAIAAVLAIPIVLASAIVLPVFIEPLFNTYTPLPPSPLTKSILDLAQQHGVHASSVYVFDLSKQETSANAFVSGIGSVERIALSDTLLKTFKPDEVLYITAHELGHYVHGDLWRGALYEWQGALVMIAFLSVVGGAIIKRTPSLARGLSDPAVAPLIFGLLLLFGLAAEPVGNALSRQIEHNADVFAAANTQLGTAGVRAFARLGSQGLSTMHPDPLVVWYFYTHPPLDERIDYAAAHAGLTGGRSPDAQ